MWHLPQATPPLAPGEVHLWRARCVPVRLEAHQYAAILGAWEMARANRLATEELRRRYVQAHLLLHLLLGTYTQSISHHYELAGGEYGKPFLRSPQLDPPLAFNLSHSGEVVLVAFVRGKAIGVDVEQMRPLPELDTMIAATCSPRERTQLMELPEHARLEAFYRLWTRKEAWLKMRGTGLLKSLRESMAALTVLDDVLENEAEVTLRDLPLGEWSAECVGALALPRGSALAPITVLDAVWLL